MHGWHDGCMSRATVFSLRDKHLHPIDRSVRRFPEFLGKEEDFLLLSFQTHNFLQNAYCRLHIFHILHHHASLAILLTEA